MTQQKGISIIIVFLILTVMVAIILNVSSILLSQVKLMASFGNNISSLYAAESGIEKTLYFERHHIPFGQKTGFCNVCTLCKGSDCKNCSLKPTVEDGQNNCSISRCNNCTLHYQTEFDQRLYNVEAQISNNVLYIESRGAYNNSSRTLEIGNKN